MMLNARRFLPGMQALTAIEAVARLGSFSRAAQELALTQSAISRQIALVERQLGVKLFERTTRQVTPTPEGAAYAAQIAEALSQLRQAAMAAMMKTHDRLLRLAVLPSFATRWLTPRLPGFLARHPEITLSFRDRIGRVDFPAEAMDAAIHVGQPDWPQTEFTELWPEWLVPVVAPALAGADLAGLRPITLASRPRAWAVWAQSAAGSLTAPVAPPLVFERFDMAAQAAMAGLGVALLPDFLIAADLAAGRLHPLGPPSASGNHYFLAVPQARAQAPQVVAFRTWILSEAADFRRPSACA